MVAETAPLPNIRKLFIPAPGYFIFEADLSGADAQVVAWEADDADLKDAFRRGLKLHIKNARDVFPSETEGWSDEALKATDHPGGIYHNCKRAVHGTNYGGSARAIAIATGWLVAEAERFQRTWFGLHPGIKDWHDRTAAELASNRSVRNKFGYRITYFDRVDGLLPEALAWVPQSTVAINCNRGIRQVGENVPCVEWLLQVHDSGVGQIPLPRRDALDALREHLRVVVPYDDPLEIPWNITTSKNSWGDCT